MKYNRIFLFASRNVKELIYIYTEIGGMFQTDKCCQSGTFN